LNQGQFKPPAGDIKGRVDIHDQMIDTQGAPQFFVISLRVNKSPYGSEQAGPKDQTGAGYQELLAQL
jgi:hypothetical protein